MIKTELRDVVFTAKGESVSLSSFGLHVEKNGLTSIFQLPTYGNIKSVDWQEYDGEDVDFSSASLNATPLQINIFGKSEDIDAMVASLRRMSKSDSIQVGVKIDEGNFNNQITFSTKFDKAVKSRLVIENEHQLEYYLLTDEGERLVLTEAEFEILAGIMEKKWRNIAFATITLTRHDNSEYFGLLADNTRTCQGIPNLVFTDEEYPNSNMPLCLKRYHLSDRQATEVSTFNFFDDLVYCYPLKGVMQGMNGIEESKTPFVISTENMVGQVMETKNADKRKGKTISIPLLIRSHSVSAIFRYLGKLKNYIHSTIKGGDMLYLCSEKAGDYAVYPTSYSVTRAYITDQPWVEMTVQFKAYKRGYDFTADTDINEESNPEPILPPAPQPTWNPYKDIDRSRWQVFNFPHDRYCPHYPLLLKATGYQSPFNMSYTVTNDIGWSCYSSAIQKYPVGTLFFAQQVTSTETGLHAIFTCVLLPWFYDALASFLNAYEVVCTLKHFTPRKLILLGVVQECDVLADNIRNWESVLQNPPKYGGIVGDGTVRVHSSVYQTLTSKCYLPMTITTSDDYDTLVDNIISDFNDVPERGGYYTTQGLNNALNE